MVAFLHHLAAKVVSGLQSALSQTSSLFQGVASTISSGAKYVASQTTTLFQGVASAISSSAKYLINQISSLAPSPTTTQIQTIFAADNTAFSLLQGVQTDWVNWVNANSTNGPAEFGSVNFEGTIYYNFDILSAQIGAWAAANAATVIPAVAATKASQTVETTTALANVFWTSAQAALPIVMVWLPIGRT
ncbi:uncharacterized protein LY89DRAFT_330263 [Mollisia scopiformis]|uniref:Uncharacterized protein n=1 Tax=Mollisia scopiformis TaxID=149040 RepID=A0A132B7P8_MOLSC|nr:uncharacterized protein LY89DRAFT_330263 [Mollisia scopiformis]KUJ08430.1 hypothetical protein LY89DRAFT_330263 [Mollisia scopiformis]